MMSVRIYCLLVVQFVGIQYVHAQAGKLKIRIQPNSVLYGRDINSIEIHGYVTLPTYSFRQPDSGENWYRAFDMEQGRLSAVIDSIPYDSVRVILTGRTAHHSGGCVTLQHFPDTAIYIAPIHPGYGTKELVVPYPPYCAYYARRLDKTCPTCGKQDKVIPIEYGLLLEDPTKPSPCRPNNGNTYSGGCTVTGCDPYWHCERDKTEF